MCSALECITFEEKKSYNRRKNAEYIFACVLLDSCLFCMDKSTSFIVVFKVARISV